MSEGFKNTNHNRPRYLTSRLEFRQHRLTKTSNTRCKRRDKKLRVYRKANDEKAFNKHILIVFTYMKLSVSFLKESHPSSWNVDSFAFAAEVDI